MAENPLTPISSGGVGFLRRLFGPAASELGETLADRVRVYRANNLRKILDQAQAKIGNHGVEELPLRFSIPLIEKASLEDDDVLSAMWSNLLADASKEITEDHYLLLRVLSALTPRSVALLDYIVGDFHTNEDWYNELDWEGDWLQDLEEFVVKEIEPKLHEGTWKGEHADLAEKVIDFGHGKPFWIFRVELPIIMKDVKKGVDAGRSLDDFGALILPISVEDSSLQILEREQLLVRRKHEFELRYCPFAFSYVAATPLGVELVKTCKPTIETDINKK